MLSSPSRIWLIGFAALSISLVSPYTVWAQDEAPSDQDNGPTPLNEFAPEDVRPSHTGNYDQGVTISKVTIEGNKLINESKIKDIMITRPGNLYSKRNLQQDLHRIYDMGYFTEQIKAVPISTSDGIHLRIEVQENAPVTGINVEGNTKVKAEDIQQIFAGQTGLPQNIGQLNESIAKIEKIYADKGYVLAKVKSIQDDPDGVINLSINEGIIDKLQFVGNRKTRDSVIRRTMATKAGDVYDEKLLSQDLKRIYSSQAFSDVRRVITVSPDDPDKYNLTVEVDEKRTGAISLGGGVDTATGLFGSLGFNDPNFLGRGQSFSSSFLVGSGVIAPGSATANVRTYQFEVGWNAPSLWDTPNALGVSAYGRDLASLNVPLAVERRIGTDVTWARPLTSLGKNVSGSLTLRGENVRLREGASKSDLAEFDLTSADRKDILKGGTFVSVSPTLAYDTRDNRFNPTQGWLNTVSVGAAYGLGGGSYGTAATNLRKYFKIRDGITLALNAQGATNAFGDIPEFNMFRLGGSYSVRGFQEGGLGSGSGFMLGSAELRSKIPLIGKAQKIPVLDTLTGALFMDAGTIFRESVSSKQFDRPGMGVSIGAGIRFTIPGVGPIRLDYAIPIASGNSRYARHFNFGVGQKF